ncbi:MAG: rod-binding protein [Rhizobiales bacterium]|nr:rod-binding protein [Hyphomicrobiales bacterium]
MNITTSALDINSAMQNIASNNIAAKTAKASVQFKQYLNPETNKPLELSTSDKQKIEKTATEFEAMFLTNMLEQMYKGIELEKPFGAGNNENIYRSMLIGKYAESMSQGGGIGIASQLKDSITKMQLGI